MIQIQLCEQSISLSRDNLMETIMLFHCQCLQISDYMSVWTVQKNKQSLKRDTKINKNECRRGFVPKQNTSIVMKVLSYLSFLSLMLLIIPVRDMTAEALRKLRPFGNRTIMNLKFTFELLFVRCLCPTSPIKWLSCNLFWCFGLIFMLQKFSENGCLTITEQINYL